MSRPRARDVFRGERITVGLVSPAGLRRGAAIENEDEDENELADETADGIVGIDAVVGIPFPI